MAQTDQFEGGATKSEKSPNSIPQTVQSGRTLGSKDTVTAPLGSIVISYVSVYPLYAKYNFLWDLVSVSTREHAWI